MDCVIIGQGLAGTTLAWHLLWRGARCLVIDRDEAVTSSKIAGGLMTPVTGQRLVPTWRLHDVWPAAVEFYRRVESLTEAPLLHQRGHVRLFRSAIEQDRYAARDLTDIPVDVRQPEPPIDKDWFEDSLGGFEMPLAGQLDVATYLEVSRSFFERSGMYREADVDPATGIRPEPDGVQLPELGIRAKRLIFCEGFAARENPWLQGIAFDPTRGEILTIRVPGLAESRIINRGVWLAPIGDGLFRVGSTYDWENLDAGPTDAGCEELTARLREFLRLPFELVEHSAAVRPIVVGRHPIIGMHPGHPQLGVFNGLGSKGSLQAPYFAAQFAEFLTTGGLLDEGVDVQQRFSVGRVSRPVDSEHPGRERTGRETHPTPSPRPRLTEVAHSAVDAVVRPGETVIDATAGNGHDTCFLARLVGSDGVVFAFDVQSQALQRTRERLSQHGLCNVTTLQQDHSQLKSALPESLHGRVAAVMFNLGYLPGGDKAVITTPQTTVEALRSALDVLRPGGVVTIVAYVGHAGGAAENSTIERLLESLTAEKFSVETVQSSPATETSPRLHVVTRLE